MSTTTPCPTPEQLDDLLANRLPAAEAEAIRQHLSSCPICTGGRANGNAAPVPTTNSILAPPRAAGEIGWLEDHRIFGQLGEGGMSVVFDAEDTRLGRRVALKVLRPRLTDATTRERFLREARLIAGLPHDHIVTVYRVGEANGVPYLTMERLEGLSLEERLKREKWLPLAEALALTREAAQGLVAAHEAGLVHRDIKPANIWLETKQGRFRRVKLIDFGIARLLHQDSSLTSTGQVLGTPMYMAPEQAAGKPVDGRTDLYSLGCVLFHMVTGRPPFDGREPNTMALLHAVITGDAPRVRDAAPQLPAAVAELIQQLLERDADKWPENARELVERLKHLEEVTSTLAPVPPPPLRTASADRLMRRPGILGIWLGILAISAALIVGLVSLWDKIAPHGGSKEEPEKPPAVAAPSGPEIKVGLLHSMTGPIALHARPVARATRFAVEEINKAGGVMGRPIKVFEEDGESDENVFAEKARKLIEDDGVTVLFGCWTSTARKRVAAVCHKHDRLLFFPASSEGLEESPNVVYLGGVPNQNVIPLARWAYADKGKRRFYLIGSDAIYSHAVNAILDHEIAQLGGRVVGTRYARLTDTDFSKAVEEIKASKADLVINTIDGRGNLALFQSLRNAGITPDKVPTAWVSLSECELAEFRVREMLGDFSVGCYFESLPGEANRTFVERFRERYGASERVNDTMETAYLGVHLWKNAVEKAGDTATKGLREALCGLHVNSPEGVIKMDETNQHAYRTARVGEIVEGKGTSQFRIVYQSPEPLRAVPFPAWRSEEAWKKFLNDLYVKWGNKWGNE